jgi:hypothetical protein
MNTVSKLHCFIFEIVIAKLQWDKLIPNIRMIPSYPLLTLNQTQPKYTRPLLTLNQTHPKYTRKWYICKIHIFDSAAHDPTYSDNTKV